ncbi:HEAT repeat domain-containing protein, partial [Thermodesulfobacteriota bacterium]
DMTPVYFTFLGHEHPDLRLVALVLYGESCTHEKFTTVLRRCLNDTDHRVRNLALRLLMKQGDNVLEEAREEVERLLEDAHMEIKRSALRVLRRIRLPTSAGETEMAL